MDTQRLSQTVQPLLDWFRTHARTLPWRADREPYHVWLSEIMLQQTRVEAVRGYYARFLAAAPDVFALAALPEAQLLKLWEGLGYYNRARKAQECARVIAARGGVWPDTVEALRALPGIGPYTAGAIASICFERPAAAVDGNVLRVCARVLDDATPIDNAAHKTGTHRSAERVLPRRALRRSYAGAHGARRDRLRPEPRAAVRGLPDRSAVSRARTRHGGRPAGQGAKARQARRGAHRILPALRRPARRRAATGQRIACRALAAAEHAGGCSTSSRRAHLPADRGSATCGCAARATAGTSSRTSSGRCAATRSSARPCRRNTAGQRRTSCARRSPCRLRSGSFWRIHTEDPAAAARSARPLPAFAQRRTKA